MHFSAKSLKKFRRLRRRAWIVGAVFLSGCAYLGGRLAWAHSQPTLPPLPERLPAALRVQQQQCHLDFGLSVACSAVKDPLANPILHAQEESCAEQGHYPSGEEFAEVGEDWEYSSLEGLKRASQATGTPPLPLEEVEARWPWVGKQHRVGGKWDLEQLGWQSGLPFWAFATPAQLQSHLPEGLSLDSGVQAVEVKAWPASGKAELSFHLEQPLEIAPDEGLEQTWKSLPNAAFMVCMRREVAVRLWNLKPRQPALRWLLPCERWAGLAYQSELESEGLKAQWSRMQEGWMPWAAWSDHPVASTPSSCSFQMVSDRSGTLVSNGIPCQAGSSTRPWEAWEGALPAENRVGAGRAHLAHAGQHYRVEWLAGLEGSKVLVQLRWTPYTPSAEESEVAVQGPDLERLYTPRPNVIAGQ